MGFALEKKGKLKQALQAYSKSLALSPDNGLVKSNLLRALTWYNIKRVCLFLAIFSVIAAIIIIAVVQIIKKKKSQTITP
jgi:tetratricopeptide (TPR) repeat protein